MTNNRYKMRLSKSEVNLLMMILNLATVEIVSRGSLEKDDSLALNLLSKIIYANTKEDAK